MPKYSEMSGRVENLPGHKPLDKYDLPEWCAHPLREPAAQPNMLIFPGEQTHYAGMLAACQSVPQLQDMVELASEAFDFDVQRVLEECGPEDNADRTDRSQMLAYVADCVAFELLKQHQPDVALKPRAVAGFSVGEVAALVAAGVMSYDQGLIIVKARGEAMQQWADEEDMAAVAVFGMDEDQLLKLCSRVNPNMRAPSQQKVFIAYCWGRRGFVCAGQHSAVMELQHLLQQSSGEAVFTQVLPEHKHAGHTPLASRVAEEVEEAINSIPMNAPTCEVYFNTGYRVAAGEDPSVFVPYLLQQLTMPLRWDFIIQTSLQRGIRRFFECGPGQSLKELMIFNPSSTPTQTIRPYELTTSLKV
ncbi:beg [Symbiodinium natans]|uniref:Beg protein n=1 Tax=Symbiodinium natans TaxID=878477 RepID=A0A812QSC7_9DINO|nr:beg [Symbiodinium natans]